MQIIHQPWFSKICLLVFNAPFGGNEPIWTSLLHLLKAAINAEPSFLGQFLRSEYLQVLLKLLDPSAAQNPAANPRALILHGHKLEDVLVTLAKLVQSMCITPEGQACVAARKLPKFLVEVFTHTSVLLPDGDGLSLDTCHRVARLLAVIMKDCPASVEDMRLSLQGCLKAACSDCRSVWSSSASLADDSMELSSPRMRALQRLTNICALVESLCTADQKRNSPSAEMLREIMTEDVVSHLLSAFTCTLAPPRQLLAQLGVRHRGALPFCGYHLAANRLNSLVKTASTALPQIVLPVLYRAVDETLSADLAELLSLIHI